MCVCYSSILLLLEFYRDGKYDLDFKNKDSNPADFVRRFLMVLLCVLLLACIRCAGRSHHT